ncbi:hypothetical protein [Hespellia stercorisuis]|nr:hypothetical protein [Hespellia stercorisuis]
MKKNKNSFFEALYSNLSANFADPGNLLDEINSSEVESKVPLRLRILAEGFSRKMTGDQVNEVLAEENCDTLYARSFFEATILYALDHGMDYEQWKKFYANCQSYTSEIENRSQYFPGGKITLQQLKEYVSDNSTETMETVMLTRWMETELKETESEEDFHNFVKNNREKFSTVREKSRYYFCKYLYLYIEEKCESYYESCAKSDQQRLQYGNMLDKTERGALERFALEELSFLKPLTKLKKDAEKAKNNMSVEEKREYIENTALTPGGIFDEFNYFYFGYVSADWMEVLFELYGSFDEWPEPLRIKVAHSMNLCGMEPDEEEKIQALKTLREMEEKQRKKEEALDDAYQRNDSESKKLYQQGRVGEDYFREFITGGRDINRSTLICFLLFVKMRMQLSEENKITMNRLNRILLNCKFLQLKPDNDFDQFVIRFLRSQEPMEILEEEVEKQVVQGKNFYLYKVYNEAYCHQKELLEYLI